MTTKKRYSVNVVQPSSDEVLRLRPKSQMAAMNRGLDISKLAYKLDWGGVKTFGNLCHICPECLMILPRRQETELQYVICLDCGSHSICAYEPAIKKGFCYVAVLLAKDQYFVELVESEG